MPGRVAGRTAGISAESPKRTCSEQVSFQRNCVPSILSHCVYAQGTQKLWMVCVQNGTKPSKKKATKQISSLTFLLGTPCEGSFHKKRRKAACFCGLSSSLL